MMSKVIMFTLGVAVGSVVTWKLIEKKYKDLADEEIASVVERFKDRKPLDEKSSGFDDSYYNITNEYSVDEVEEENDDDNYIIQLDEMEDFVAPYTISPDEFKEHEDYTTKSFMFWADSVLTCDDDDSIVADPTSILGDGLEHFGDYDDECVYVRDENIKCDYEIVKSEWTFDEFISCNGVC